MRIDAGRLKSFYGSPLGESARRMIDKRIQAIWPDSDNLDVLGLGHTEVFLEGVINGARRTICASPGDNGAQRWPQRGPSSAVSVDEQRMPFPDAVFDRVLIVHGLEEADNPARLLREVWRVCAPEARILVVAANRSGLWARAESTPFGHGRPFSRTQLNALLRDAMFQPTAWARALYAPPVPWPLITHAAETWERTGEIGWRSFGGVLMVEALKRLYIEPKGQGAKKAPVRKSVQATAGPTARNASEAEPVMRNSTNPLQSKLETAD